MFGKQIRMERIIDRNSGRVVVVPLEHGISMGPIPGLVDMRDTINKISLGGATAVLMHKGMVPYGHRTSGKDIGLIVHLSAGTGLGGDPNSKVIVTTVEEALTLGADAVSIHINLGADSEPEMIRCAGEISRKCEQWGMPLLAMVYPRGKNIKDPFSTLMHSKPAPALPQSLEQISSRPATPATPTPSGKSYWVPRFQSSSQAVRR